MANNMICFYMIIMPIKIEVRFVNYVKYANYVEDNNPIMS